MKNKDYNERAYDLVMRVLRNRKFVRDGPRGPVEETEYQIIDILHDPQNLNRPLNWFLECRNLQTGENERLSLVELPYLFERGIIEDSKLAKRTTEKH